MQVIPRIDVEGLQLGATREASLDQDGIGGLKARANRLILCLYVSLIWIALAACQPALETQTPAATPSIARTPVDTPTETVPPPSTPESMLRGSVQIWTSWDPQELEGLDRVVTAFLERNPQTSIAVTYYPAHEMRSATERIKDGGNSPSVLFAPSTWGPWLWREGYVLDLTGRLDAEIEDAVHPLAWSQVDFEGAYIALPLEMQGVVLYRNRALVESPPETVADWVAVSQEIKDEQVVGSALDFGFDFSGSQIAACNGTLFDGSGQIAINSAEGICWLELMALIRPAGRVTMNNDSDLAAFIADQAAWMIDGSWNLRRLEQALGTDRLTIDPWPVYQPSGRQLAGFVWTENIFLFAETPPADLEASWAFTRFLATPEAQLILSDPAGADHITVLSGLEMTDALQVQIFGVLSSGFPLPLKEDLDLYKGPLEAAVDAVAVQGSDPALAIEVALVKVELATSGGTESE